MAIGLSPWPEPVTLFIPEDSQPTGPTTQTPAVLSGKQDCTQKQRTMVVWAEQVSLHPLLLLKPFFFFLGLLGRVWRCSEVTLWIEPGLAPLQLDFHLRA